VVKVEKACEVKSSGKQGEKSNNWQVKIEEINKLQLKVA
jgi:hypothetical protein